MHVANTKDALILTFSFLEARIIRRQLKEIIANYQINPHDLEAKAAAVWYSTRGCERAGLSAEETREWLENLHQYKRNSVQHLEKWMRSLQVPKEGQPQLKIKLADVSVLLTALNDHRLLLAARHDIGQKEMDMRSLSALSELPAAQQTAISEITFLGWIVEELLRFLPGNPAGWMDSAV